jgi:hypothetical protein
MASKIIETYYDICEVSSDGLIKHPKERGYGGESNRFYGSYITMEEVERAILENGEQYTDYIVLTVKRIGSA